MRERPDGRSESVRGSDEGDTVAPRENRWMHAAFPAVFPSSRRKPRSAVLVAGARCATVCGHRAGAFQCAMVGISVNGETSRMGLCTAVSAHNATRRVRLAWSRTPASHAGNTGSNPVRGTDIVRFFSRRRLALLPPPSRRLVFVCRRFLRDQRRLGPSFFLGDDYSERSVSVPLYVSKRRRGPPSPRVARMPSSRCSICTGRSVLRASASVSITAPVPAGTVTAMSPE